VAGDVPRAIGLVRRGPGQPQGRSLWRPPRQGETAKGLSRGAEFLAPRFLASPQVLASLRKPYRSEDDAQSAGIAPHLANQRPATALKGKGGIPLTGNAPFGSDLASCGSRLGQADRLLGSDQVIGLLARVTQRRVHELTNGVD
jgi:hypothetical protein